MIRWLDVLDIIEESLKEIPFNKKLFIKINDLIIPFHVVVNPDPTPILNPFPHNFGVIINSFSYYRFQSIFAVNLVLNPLNFSLSD